MADFPSHAQLSNLTLIEELYREYAKDPASVAPSWRHFFEGIDFSGFLYQKGKSPSPDISSARIFGLVQAYRRFGHLLAHFNPFEGASRSVAALELKKLGFAESELESEFPTLGFCKKEKAPLKEILAALQEIYCGRIGFEYMDLENCEIERWIQKKIEPELIIHSSSEEKQRILESLNKSEVFETFLNTKYQGQTRFSLEGEETLIPLLAALLSFGSDHEVEEFVIGMAHRGRLNVLANILNKPYSTIFKEFEDTIPFSFGESGDVKYHKGFSSEVKMANGKTIALTLSANSSCLESIDPIALGQVRAKQVLKGDQKKVGSILLHGDASLAGQGVVYETLQMFRLPGFATGGTIHIALNNQIGYTTLPEEGRSTRYCTDIAKAFSSPIFHLNAEDPESCLFAARLAMELRLAFQCDVFLELNGFRKYGHNEGDEPQFTQPLLYKEVRSRPSIRQIYVEKLSREGFVEKKMAEALEVQFKDTLAQAFEKGKIEEPLAPAEHIGQDVSTQAPEEILFQPFATAVAAEELLAITSAYCRIPDGFHLHPKLEKWLESRRAMVQGDRATPSIDWGMAECLAFGSLACQGIPVRLAGQDVLRGTFSQRHAGWFDQETGELYLPFSHLREGQASIDVYNTILSEYAALGFEFGYNWCTPKGLGMWEAQYGDFVIGAEIVIDHYLTCAEQKWSRLSSLVLLLPHGYEGGGAEHSSGRIERFLELCAGNNIQVAYPTTPAQYFHVLRRQALRPIRKPLVLFTPKSLLRLPACMSALRDFTEGEFQEVLEDPVPPSDVKRIFLCSGKIFYDLLSERMSFPDAALVRLEQIYPLHQEKLQKTLAKYESVSEWLWVQEEPKNMGAWPFLSLSLQEILPNITWRCISRPASSTTATGSRRKHKEEQAALLTALKKS